MSIRLVREEGDADYHNHRIYFFSSRKNLAALL